MFQLQKEAAEEEAINAIQSKQSAYEAVHEYQNHCEKLKRALANAELKAKTAAVEHALRVRLTDKRLKGELSRSSKKNYATDVNRMPFVFFLFCFCFLMLQKHKNSHILRMLC